MAQMESKLGVCGLCGSECIIRAQMENGQIKSVAKGDHPVLKNNICVKGTVLKQYIHHKDRLTQPLKLVGEKGSGEYVPISWDEALDIIAKRLLKTREESGANKTVFFVGHPKWARRPVAAMATAYGTPNFCTESSSCHTAMSIAWKLTTGLDFPMPDAAHTDVYVIWSQNQAGADGSLKEIMGMKARGVKTIVVDPRVTPVAARADLHLQPVPGTDGALALGIANVILSRGLEAKEYIEKYAYGFEEYKKYVSEFTPEKVQQITGVPAEKIVEAALIMAGKKIAIKCSSCSLFHCINGVQNYRAVLSLSVLTGSFGMDGGNKPAGGNKVIIDTFHHNLWKIPNPADSISGGKFPVWEELIDHETQCAHLADYILNEDPYKIRNLVVFSMNTHIFPRPDKMKEALKKVEFVAVAELFWNEACEMADVVLPAAAPAERNYVYLGKGNKLVYLPSLVEPEQKRNDVEIVLDLCHRMGLHGEIPDLADYDAYLNYIIRKTGVTLEELKANPDGIEARKFIPGKPFNLETDVKTPTGKLELFSSVMEKYQDMEGYDTLPVWRDWREYNQNYKEYPYVLTAGPRRPYYWHSRTYRLEWISNLEAHTQASISLADAEKLGLADGDKVKLSTPVDSRIYTVYVDGGLLPGVVYVNHGDGDQDINLLLDDTINDPVSGFPVYRTNLCRIEKA